MFIPMLGLCMPFCFGLRWLPKVASEGQQAAGFPNGARLMWGVSIGGSRRGG